MTDQNNGFSREAYEHSIDNLIGSLADEPLAQRSKHINPSRSDGGTWLGAISHPIFEGFSNEEALLVADVIQDELDAPEPTEYLIDEMRVSYGVGSEWGGDDEDDAAEAAAVIAAAIYGRLGLPLPEEDADDMTPGSEPADD